MGEPAMHGITPREQQVIDLYESGLDPARIARSMGVSRKYASSIISTYAFHRVWGAGDKFNAMVRQGTADLARAIARSGGQFL